MKKQQNNTLIKKDERAKLGYSWFQAHGDYDGTWQILPLFADASFRRYFRLKSGNQSLVLLDSPPNLEPLRPFIAIANQWRQQSVYVPKVMSYDMNQGFALLEDLGDQHLASVSEEDQVSYYKKAVKQLLRIQRLKENGLPNFNSDFISKELSIMLDWTLPWLGRAFSMDEKLKVEGLFQWLVRQVCEQPSCVIHRDYHCRNLMVRGDQLAVIDFQGAMVGPWSYDLVSLLSDAYKELPKNQLVMLQKYYLEGCAFNDCGRDFFYDFAVTQLQRHIKILGIFCRLSLRDDKHHYLRHIVTVCRHICSASESLLLCEDCQHSEALSLMKSICQEAVEKVQS